MYYCLICTDPFENSRRRIISTICGHLYHLQCINQWCKVSKTCPVCKGPLPTGKLVKLFPSTNVPCENNASADDELSEILNLKLSLNLQKAKYEDQFRSHYKTLCDIMQTIAHGTQKEVDELLGNFFPSVKGIECGGRLTGFCSILKSDFDRMKMQLTYKIKRMENMSSSHVFELMQLKHQNEKLQKKISVLQKKTKNLAQEFYACRVANSSRRVPNSSHMQDCSMPSTSWNNFYNSPISAQYMESESEVDEISRGARSGRFNNKRSKNRRSSNAHDQEDSLTRIDISNLKEKGKVVKKKISTDSSLATGRRLRKKRQA